jgi:hypothetical protein
MNCKKGHKEPKHLPYGATRGRYWCWGCDAEIVPEWLGPNPKSIKKRARRLAKKEINNSLYEALFHNRRTKSS